MPKAAKTAIEKWLKFSIAKAKDQCWDWLGYINDNGYALIRFTKFNIRAHRFAYESYIGPIPEGLVLDHTCRNRACVNPFHLEPVTNVVNMLRGIRSNQNVGKTHCKRNHELTPSNIYWSGGKRGCKRCASLRQKGAFADE